jgi:hypothetical protein
MIGLRIAATVIARNAPMIVDEKYDLLRRFDRRSNGWRQTRDLQETEGTRPLSAAFMSQVAVF